MRTPATGVRNEGWLEIRLPAPLSHLAKSPHGRCRLSCPVEFSCRGGEVAAQAASGAVRYDIAFDPERGRWYLYASWRVPPRPAPGLEDLRGHRPLAVDLNHAHLAAWTVTPDGRLRKAQRQPPRRRKTATVDQAAHDRSGPPAEHSPPPSVQER